MHSISLPANSPLLKRPFLFGTATSSFQIEGDVENRLECIWDRFCERPSAISDNSNGDVACDHIARWKEDFNILLDLNVDAYRFSISWPRVMTQGGELNPKGVAFYKTLIDALNEKGIKPFVTLYHWDLPQYLEDKGGWLYRQTVYEFQNYVDKITRALGEDVFSYATFNEPFCSAYLGYEIGVHAPGRTGTKNGRTAAHHILLAHGLGIKTLRENVPNSEAGIVLNFTPCYPATQKPEDVLATRKADDYINQWYMQPVMVGSYPEVILDLDDEDRPPVEPGDMETICQPIDFLGINFYTRLHYSAPKEKSALFYEHPHQGPQTDIGWEIYPKALYDLLTSLNERYTLPPIFITENGAAMADELINGSVNDVDRIDYYNAHLNMIHNAMIEGVEVSGYFAWSLLDNFEWAEGYEKRFGLVYVDFKSQERTLKRSANAYKTLLASRT